MQNVFDKLATVTATKCAQATDRNAHTECEIILARAFAVDYLPELLAIKERRAQPMTAVADDQTLSERLALSRAMSHDIKRNYPAQWHVMNAVTPMATPITIEAQRRTDFAKHGGLDSYISIALECMQLSENDEACSDGRDARDTGTIYTLTQSTYETLKAHWLAFVTDCAAHIADALDLVPGDDGLRYTDIRVSIDGLAGTYWLAQTGSGVDFTDDGDAPALQAMADYADAHSVEGLYFGDNGKVYI